MPRPLFALAMIAVLLACPLVCMAGAFANGECRVACCCGRCHPVPQGQPDQTPSQKSGGGLCCLCKGAIAAKAVLFDALDRNLTQPAAASLAATMVEPVPAAVDCGETAGCLTLSGRMLRLEFCALTC